MSALRSWPTVLPVGGFSSHERRGQSRDLFSLLNQAGIIDGALAGRIPRTERVPPGDFLAGLWHSRQTFLLLPRAWI